MFIVVNESSFSFNKIMELNNIFDFCSKFFSKYRMLCFVEKVVVVLWDRLRYIWECGVYEDIIEVLVSFFWFYK